MFFVFRPSDLMLVAYWKKRSASSHARRCRPFSSAPAGPPNSSPVKGFPLGDPHRPPWPPGGSRCGIWKRLPFWVPSKHDGKFWERVEIMWYYDGFLGFFWGGLTIQYYTMYTMYLMVLFKIEVQYDLGFVVDDLLWRSALKHFIHAVVRATLSGLSYDAGAK